MMVPQHGSWLRLIVRYRGTELPRTKYRIAGVFALACVVTYAELALSDEQFHSDLHPLPFTLIGFALSIFLGFRNNTAYDRWWEGRKLWGGLINTTRSFARQLLTLVSEVPEGRTLSTTEKKEIVALQAELVKRVIAFTHALRLSLREIDDLSELEAFLPKDEVEALKKESNRPSAISKGTADRIQAAWHKGWIHPLHVGILEQSLVTLTDIQGACERIKNTPIPLTYTTLIHRIVAVYCYGLPFGVVSEVGALTPLVVLVVSYAFFGLDTIGDEIEQPFGMDDNDLPLDQMSRLIEVNLRQRLGEKDLPPLLKPVGEYLS
ncbi:MAG: bestrophin [Sandaracinaceae bacterium]|nr:bestrophin [Sandaracinaceae bacterium]